MDDALAARRAAVERMVGQYGQDIYRLCCMYLKDASMAQDAVQETFLKAFRYYDGFRHESSEKTWLISIALHTCRNMLRTGWFKWVDRSVTPEELPLPAPEGRVEVGDVAAAVLQLDAKVRIPIVLHYYHGLKVKEIAALLHVPVNTVLTRLRRGREKLKIILEEGGAQHV